jgi:TRAP-type mannitol/chloroaromatic compound transport system permease small subunit
MLMEGIAYINENAPESDANNEQYGWILLNLLPAIYPLFVCYGVMALKWPGVGKAPALIAMIVAMGCAYTFVQGGHVRVDLVYGAVSRRTKKIIDMAGSLIFMLPVLVLTWMYAWFFLWRHLITPKISASDKIEMLMRKARILKWNVETIGFSPNGFNAYFLFKVLIVAFVAMMFIQAMAFFFRNLLELMEGEEADGRYHDEDVLGDDDMPAHFHDTV